MLASHGNESSIGKIENCEFFDVGQAFKLGRYPIHFHMLGNVNQSYIKNNSIHQSYNRATTLHGVHYLTVSGNVAYKTLGHAIFLEDAIETNNRIENNLVIDVRASNSLLNTDQTPACFWITNPNNVFRGNHCAGSAKYGFWFDLQEHSTGPSFDANVCPENTRLGVFEDNVAHSVGRYGLRIFSNMLPRQHPCQPYSYDNLPVTATFKNFQAYKCGRNGAIAERVAGIEFVDFKVADNLVAGAEMSITDDIPVDGYTKISGGLFVGKSENSEPALEEKSPHGVITPASEGFTLENAKFYNYDFNSAAALGDCSHCFHPSSTDSGARTYTVSGLHFDDLTTPRRIRYQYPQRGIFHDVDGSLTGAANQFATYAAAGERAHLQQAECTLDEAKLDGIYCDDTVQIRRIAFYDYRPGSFSGVTQNIIKYDNVPSDATDLEIYLADQSNYGNIFFKRSKNPSNSWASPFVTGHQYRVTWADDLDFTQMRVEVSQKWQPADANLMIVLPFDDARQAINVQRTDSAEEIAVDTLQNHAPENWLTGFNSFENSSSTQEFTFVVNGKEGSAKDILLNAVECIGSCDADAAPVDDTAELPDFGSFWSDPASWPSGQVPAAGQNVVIAADMWILLDVPATDILGLLTIDGRLEFADHLGPINLRAKQVYVRAGELLIGSEANRFQNEAQITLYGESSEEAEIMVGAVETGSKQIVNTGRMEMFGMSRSRDARLQISVYNGSDIAYVEAGLDWMAGEEIYFAPTNHQYEHSEYRTIVAYESSTGKLVVDTPFEHYHFGEAATHKDAYAGLDQRGEVRLLNRNIRIVGDQETEGEWGCNILTTDRTDFDGTQRKGYAKFDSVEVARCSQKDTYKAAIRFENTGSNSEQSFIKNSVVHDSEAWSLYISNSRDIQVESSDFIGSKQVGVNLRSITDCRINDIFVADVRSRVNEAGDNYVDKEACVAYCSFFEPNRCQGNTFTNSIAAGCVYSGFVAPGHTCGDDSSELFRNNVAHSSQRTGAHIYPDPANPASATCYQGSHFSAYKCREGGITTMYNTRE